MFNQSLQHYPYLNQFERCERLQNFSELNNFLRKVFTTPEVIDYLNQILNDSFKLNTYRISVRDDHNLDFTFIMRFFNDLIVNATGASSFVTNCLVILIIYTGIVLQSN
jgi:hypothetical protein